MIQQYDLIMLTLLQIQIVMHYPKQKQSRSDDQFETMTPEVQTIIHQPAPMTVANKTYHPRSKNMSEKHKLGLQVSPLLSQPSYSPYQTSKNSMVPHGKILKVGSYTFKSNFETGSIGAVDLIGQNSFSITLDPESNASRGNTWFYFSVEGIKGEAQFMVKGFTKSSSLFNQGMKICYRDVKENGKWRRGGTKISYDLCTDKDEEERTYCLKFNFFFKSSEPSSVEFAYSFPYSFEKLTHLITTLGHKIKCTTLCPSYDGRNIPLITIGNHNSKDLIVISARVHPGQTGSSFIAEGFLKQITSDSPHAHFLREKFLFKIVPMINVDGVCRGNYRFSASGVDLNRKWKNPSQQHHPQIYHLKQMIRNENSQRQLRMYIDLHGHSRKKNVFFYGCCPANSEQTRAKAFPYLMSKIYNTFNYQDACFSVQKDKQGTARVALFKQFKIPEIFTLETSFCGPAGGANFTENQYEKLGCKLCQGISAYFYEPYENHPQGMKYLAALKETSMNELSGSPFLLRVGNEDGSSSDSQPEKGEHEQKQKQKQKEKPSTSKMEARKRANNVTSAQTNYNKRAIPKIPSTLKQKSEASILITQENQQKQRDLYMYLLEAPSQIFQADFRNNKSTLNQRVHSHSKQTSHKTVKSNVNIAEETNFSSINSQKATEKTKVNLMMSREGAQYRRVRKMAEQSLRHENLYSEPGVVEVKGIRGNKLEIDHTRPKIRSYLLEKTKFRRTSAQMFFKKPVRIQQRELTRNELNVLCRGHQIIF